MLLAKPPSPAEVVNDLNGDLVNLYRHAQFHLVALIQEVEFTLTSRAELTGLIEQPGLTGLQQAARYLLRNRISFGGGGTSFAVSKTGQPSREGVLELLRAFNRRLRPQAVFGELLIRKRSRASGAVRAQKTARFRAVAPALKLEA